MKINWLSNLVLLLFGLVFAAEALRIPSDGESIGARLVPFWMSVIMALLVAVQIVNDLRSRAAGQVELESAEPFSGDAGLILVDRFLYRSAPLVLLMGLYAVFQLWFGYLLASLLISYLVFRIFGNDLKTILIHGTVGSVLLFLLFVKLLNIYDPPGSLIDLSWL